MNANIVELLNAHTIPYLHIFVRVSGIFVLTPILSMEDIPLQGKAILAAVLALVVYPVTSPYVVSANAFNSAFFLLLLSELTIGLLIGLIVSIYQTAFLMAAGHYSIPMGFGILNVIDPMSQSSVPIIGQLKSMFAVMIFVVIGGHHMVIEALVYSFRTVSYLTLDSAEPIFLGLSAAMREMFLVSFQMAAPILGTIFLVELVLGIFSKIAPQMNIMVVGFQLKIVIGLGLLTFALPVFVTVAETLFARSFQVVEQVLAAIA